MVLEIYCTEHEFLWPFLCFSRALGLYFSKKDSCLALMAPRRLLCEGYKDIDRFRYNKVLCHCELTL